ncbi:MAG: hypothetical protein MZV64_17750 [Ignavibacteriales bacterium]|nr:hypothetical protein [Ignavibacteriales bacterium]
MTDGAADLPAEWYERIRHPAHPDQRPFWREKTFIQDVELDHGWLLQTGG